MQPMSERTHVLVVFGNSSAPDDDDLNLSWHCSSSALLHLWKLVRKWQVASEKKKRAHARPTRDATLPSIPYLTYHTKLYQGPPSQSCGNFWHQQHQHQHQHQLLHSFPPSLSLWPAATHPSIIRNNKAPNYIVTSRKSRSVLSCKGFQRLTLFSSNIFINLSLVRCFDFSQDDFLLLTPSDSGINRLLNSSTKSPFSHHFKQYHSAADQYLRASQSTAHHPKPSTVFQHTYTAYTPKKIRPLSLIEE